MATGLEIFTEEVKRDFVIQPRDTAIRRSADVAERIGMALDAAMDSGDATTVLLLLDRLLDEQATPQVVFRKLVKMWGGESVFTARIERFFSEHPDMLADIIGVWSGKGTVAMRIRYRMNGDQTTPGGFDPDEFAALAEKLTPVVKTIPLAVAAGAVAGPQAGFGILAGSTFIHVIKPYLDEVLATAKRFWDDFATSLVEEEGLGNVLLAGTVQTLNDFFVPGSTIEAMLLFLPITRLGVLIKAVLMKAASLVGLRLAAKGLQQLGTQVFRLVKDLVDTHIGRHLPPFLNQLADQIVTVTNKQQREILLARAYKFLKTVNQWFSPEDEISYLIKRNLKKTGAKTLTAEARKKIEEELTRYFTKPFGSRAVSLTFQCLPDGSVVQTIEAKLVRNTVGRTEKNLAALAEKHGLFSRPGQDWAHLVASQLSGDDAMYNLIRASSRINRSWMTLFDNLQPGMKVRIRVFFETIDDAVNRSAFMVEYFDMVRKEVIGTLKNALGKPPLRAELQWEAFEYASQVSIFDPIGDEAARIVATLMEFFER